jgi:type II secretory pathway component PulF
MSRILDYHSPTTNIARMIPRKPELSLWDSLWRLVLWSGVAIVLLFLGVGYFSWVALLVPLVLVSAIRGIRNRRGWTILAYVEQAVRMNQPIPAMLSAAEQGEDGKTRKHLEAVRAAMVAGIPLGAALEGFVPELPKAISRYIRAGEEAGQLRQTLHDLIRKSQAPALPQQEQWAFVRCYVVMMVIIGGLVVGMLAIFVVPRFEKIFSDFHISLGPWHAAFFVFMQNIGPWLIISLIVLAIGYLGWTLAELTSPRRLSRVLRRPLDWLSWHCPLLGRLILHRNLSESLSIVAGGIDAGLSLPQAILPATILDLNHCFAQKLWRWHQGLLSGQSPTEAARAAHLPPLVVGVVGATSDSLADALRYLASHYAERHSRLLVVLSAAVAPAAALLMGVFVAFVALSLFDPMVRLIYAAMGGVKGRF